MSSILFGSIGTLADTSELQRESFNEAFKEHGLDWNWSVDEYRELLTGSGGRQRIADYARERGEDVDAGAVHETKSRLFRERLGRGDVQPRDGVAETIDAARRDGVALAFVTTTSRANVDAVLQAVAPDVDPDSFQVVVDAETVDEAKPAPDAYAHALSELGEQPGDCVAIEDNVGGVQAATAAGVRCVAFPGTNNAGHDFSGAERTVSSLSLAGLLS